MIVRCPVSESDYPDDPRTFVTGKIIEIDDLLEAVTVKIEDPYGYRKFFDFIPDIIKSSQKYISRVEIKKGTKVKYNGKEYTVATVKKKSEEFYLYYLENTQTNSYFPVEEDKLKVSFTSGKPNPKDQLMRFEFQNPCWYLGRQVVSRTMNVLNNAIYGFKELAGCKIYLKAFQLDTIMRCLQNNPCRFMLADEVGLGKTIEACSILKIYFSRSTSKRAAIIVPSAIVAQWRAELLFKFGLNVGRNANNNEISLIAIEDFADKNEKSTWDFVVIDEVHNYLIDPKMYGLIHDLSKNAQNILLLSATPIQQKQQDYLNLLRLINPEKYDGFTLDHFISLLDKQNSISRTIQSALDDIDTIVNEIIPDLSEEGEDINGNEEIEELLTDIKEELEDISEVLTDSSLEKKLETIDISKVESAVYDIRVTISYICDNYQFDHNIIRGRRALLGIYPKDPEGEFSERHLTVLKYSSENGGNYYEYEAYGNLTEWIIGNQNNLDDVLVNVVVKPLLTSFFSSPWAYSSKLKSLEGKIDIPKDVYESARRWKASEENVLKDIADIMDEPEQYPSRMVKLISYIDNELFGKKIVLFTNFVETFNKYYKLLINAFGDDEVVGFGKGIPKDQAEINIYRFQTDEKCRILICDRSGGEGRNLQGADYVIHIDLPWDINDIEQRIGRLDRLGRQVKNPVTSIVIYLENSYEEQLFKFWNDGLNVFRQSLSGLEIIMNDINREITESIKTDFEYGLYQVIPDLIEKAKKMRETVRREQLFDTAAQQYKPLYKQLKVLLDSYQFNDNQMFSNTMMSWASLSGFSFSRQGKNNIVRVSDSQFSIKAAQNALLIPPDWSEYMEKQQTMKLIKIQRGLEEEKEKNTVHSERGIIGTFDRDTALENDYIHFFAPGDEIYDCIVNNALNSYKGMSTALAAKSSIYWRGFVYTFSIEPNERLLIENNVPLMKVSTFRNYLASGLLTIPVPLSDVTAKNEQFIKEYNRLVKEGYFDDRNSIEHLGRRGKKGSAFLGISTKYGVSNIDWFKAIFPVNKWKDLVEKSYTDARGKAVKSFANKSNLREAKETIDSLMSAREASSLYFSEGKVGSENDVKTEYDVIFQSLRKPVIKLESACFIWLMNDE